MQLETRVRDMRVFVDLVHPLSVKQRGTALNAMYLVALLKKKLGEIATILSGNTGDQCTFHAVRHSSSLLNANVIAHTVRHPPRR